MLQHISLGGCGCHLHVFRGKLNRFNLPLFMGFSCRSRPVSLVSVPRQKGCTCIWKIHWKRKKFSSNSFLQLHFSVLLRFALLSNLSSVRKAAGSGVIFQQKFPCGSAFLISSYSAALENKLSQMIIKTWKLEIDYWKFLAPFSLLFSPNCFIFSLFYFVPLP